MVGVGRIRGSGPKQANCGDCMPTARTSQSVIRMTSIRLKIVEQVPIFVDNTTQCHDVARAFPRRLFELIDERA
jgi:hypothetical protein